MTEKQFNFILRNMRQNILNRFESEYFCLNESNAGYAFGTEIICMDVVRNTINDIFNEVMEEDNGKMDT
jgi:hypothetical protein